MNILRKILISLFVSSLVILLPLSALAAADKGGGMIPSGSPEAAESKAEAGKADDLETSGPETGGSVKEQLEKAKKAQAENKPGSGYKGETLPKTLIPATSESEDDCFILIYKTQLTSKLDIQNQSISALKGTKFENGASIADVLACALKTGNFHLWMLPLLIEYVINFALSIAGLIAVLFVLIGGYLYMFGGLSEDKEKGKKAILYGIVGFVVALLAWVVVNSIQLLVTS